MRVLFLLLLLANLAFFAWNRYLSPVDPGTDGRPMRSQLDPAKVVVLPESATRTVAAPKPRPEPPATPAPPAAAAPAPAAAACVEWGSFTLADAPGAEKALEPLQLGGRLSQRRVEELAAWWVYMPPQGNRANALKKTAELKGLGIEEWFVVADEGRWRWAISLGVFRTEEAARNRLESLRAKGVRTAQVGERELQVPKIWLQARNPEPWQASRLRDIARGFPGSEVRDCAP